MPLTVKRLIDVRRLLKNARDIQEKTPCEECSYICQEFDAIIDSVEVLAFLFISIYFFEFF